MIPVFVKVRCPQCGDVTLPAHRVMLTGTQYAFGCPTCREVVTKSCSPMIAGMLRGAQCTIPPALDAEDLIDFMLDLAEPDWFSELVV